MFMGARAYLFAGRLVGYWQSQQNTPSSLSPSLSSAAAIFSSSGASTAQLDRFALIVPDELLHFLANVSQSAIGKERNEGKSLPPWRCHFHTLGLAACQQTGQSKEVEWTLGLSERRSFLSALRMWITSVLEIHRWVNRVHPCLLSHVALNNEVTL